MRLTKNLAAVILRQFAYDDASIPYLAALYKVPQDKIEHQIRLRLCELEVNRPMTIDEGKKISDAEAKHLRAMVKEITNGGENEGRENGKE